MIMLMMILIIFIIILMYIHSLWGLVQVKELSAASSKVNHCFQGGAALHDNDDVDDVDDDHVKEVNHCL